MTTALLIAALVGSVLLARSIHEYIRKLDEEK